MFTALHNFCAVDLSAFYFDIRKDRLYCDGVDEVERRATRTVLDRTFDCLVRWVVTGALEVERAAKRIGSSLQAAVELFVPERLLPLLRDIDLAELCIISAGTAQAAA